MLFDEDNGMEIKLLKSRVCLDFWLIREEEMNVNAWVNMNIDLIQESTHSLCLKFWERKT